MKQLLPLLLCLLLCGCGREASGIPETAPPTAVPAETRPSLLDPSGPENRGSLTVYPMAPSQTREILGTGEGLLVLSGAEATTLTLLAGDPLSAKAALELDFLLEARDIQVAQDHISFYDPNSRQMLVLDLRLQVLQKHVLSQQVQGSPILSQDQSTLYYCTDSAIFAWELSSGIHRTVAELSYGSQELVGLHLDQTVLQCRIEDAGQIYSLFLRTDNGQLLSRQEGDVVLTTEGSRYYALLPLSALEMPVFGQEGSIPQALYPKDTASSCGFLPRSYSAVTVSYGEDGLPLLRSYDLTGGTLRSSLSLTDFRDVRSLTEDPLGRVWFLASDPGSGRDILCCWDLRQEALPAGPQEVFTVPYLGEGSLAPQTLSRCQETAAALSEAYGIRILIGEDAVQTAPWDYSLQPETLPQVLSAELAQLDRRLSQFPEKILEKTAAHFSSLNLCLVRSITGTTETAAPDTATGIQFLEGEDAYVVIAVGKYSQQALYHELFHLMEILIYTKSTALDLWNALNPPAFSYTFGQGDPEPEEGWLTGKTRAFVDTYSMTYPKEDRARVWETALLPGNEEVFASETMQNKLTALCKGVREAYGLTKVKEVFPWEQYLIYPMVHG